MIMQNCQICGGKSEAVRTFSKRGTETLNLNQCVACNAEYLSPQPSDVWLGEEYSQYYHKRSAGMARPKLAFFKSMLKQSGFDFNGKKILEVGSGEGDCVAALNELWPDARITAVESNSESKEHYRALRCQLVQKSLEEFLREPTGEPFDFVLLFDLIEHLRNPAETLGKVIKNQLAPEGKLVATFPNADSFSRHSLGSLWPQYKVEHLFYFSKKSVEVLTDRLQMQTIELSPLKKKFPIGYVVSVGSHFGPKAVQSLTSAAGRLIPPPILKSAIPLAFGEWLWIAQKNSSITPTA